MKTREQWVEEVMCEVDYLINHYHTLNIGYVAKEKLRALLLEVPDPKGWKLVPIEPTSEMLKRKVGL